MCVYTHIHTYTYTHICIYICVYVWTKTFVFLKILKHFIKPNSLFWISYLQTQKLGQGQHEGKTYVMMWSISSLLHASNDKYKQCREGKAGVNFKDSWKTIIFLPKPHTQYDMPLIPKQWCLLPWHILGNS